jgi:HPt (histidine-containing phosphotransfer) domain-containing protein
MEEEGRSENPPHEQESLSFSEIASIDGKFLDRIRIIQDRGNPGLLKKVIGLYFQEAPKLLQRLRDASGRDDSKGMQQAAHALKSSSASLGASRLARICEEMEALARSEETAKARPLITLLENEYSQVHAALDGKR